MVKPVYPSPASLDFAINGHANVPPQLTDVHCYTVDDLEIQLGTCQTDVALHKTQNR